MTDPVVCYNNWICELPLKLQVEKYGFSLDVICPPTDFTLNSVDTPDQEAAEEQKVAECKVDYMNGNCRKCLKCVKI